MDMTVNVIKLLFFTDEGKNKLECLHQESLSNLLLHLWTGPSDAQILGQTENACQGQTLQLILGKINDEAIIFYGINIMC
jgi:hypothetical protein